MLSNSHCNISKLDNVAFFLTIVHIQVTISINLTKLKLKILITFNRSMHLPLFTSSLFYFIGSLSLVPCRSFYHYSLLLLSNQKKKLFATYYIYQFTQRVEINVNKVPLLGNLIISNNVHDEGKK